LGAAPKTKADKFKAKFDLEAWLPKSVTRLRQYDRKTFFSDLIAGVTVGLVALPLAMAFAIASGLTPQAGLYCAIVAGFLASLLGGSSTQISGPTGAFVVVVAGIVARFGAEGLFLCTLMAGLMLIALGATGLGTAVKFIPRPVVVGFTNGIAVIIASTQIKDFLGLRIEEVPGEFLQRLAVLGAHLGSASGPAMVLSIGSLILMIVAMRFFKRVPGSILALVLGTAAAMIFTLPVSTVESAFGAIPQGLPQFHIPTARLDLVSAMLPSAITVAMLGAIESLMSAVVADRMTRDKHNPNVELVAQGVANVMSPLVGGLPATGAIARTATNIRSGGKTPVAGMIHAAVLLLIVLFAAPLAGHVPLAVLAAILMIVAYNMGDWAEIPEIWRASRADRVVWFLTFALTVLVDLTVAVQAGMILAGLLYITRVTSTTTVTQVSEDYYEEGREHDLISREVPEGVAIFRIHGPFLFGSTDKINVLTEQLESLPPVVIVRMRNMTAIDTTGVQALEDVADLVHESGRQILFCGMRPQPEAMMRKAGLHSHVGEENFCRNVDAALRRAGELVVEGNRVTG
jgi:SulP family sulfate permease